MNILEKLKLIDFVKLIFPDYTLSKYQEKIIAAVPECFGEGPYHWTCHKCEYKDKCGK